MMQSRTQTEVILGKSPIVVNGVRTEKAGSKRSSLHKRMNGSNEQNKSKCSLMMELSFAVLLPVLLEESKRHRVELVHPGFPRLFHTA